MLVAPELVSVRVEGHQAGGRVHAGESLVAQCRVFGARPLPLVLWRLSDTQLDLQQNYTVEAPQRMVTSEISLKVDSSHDESTLTCCSPAHRRASDEYVCAQGLPLYVTYEPVLHIVADDEPQNKTIYVVKGSNVTLNCTYKANPTIYELMWFHEEDIVGRAEGESSLEPALSLHDVSETDAGEYICSATNEEGTAYSEPVVIDVTYPAFCEEESISQFGLAEDESINITCKVRGNPTPTSYRWVLVNDAVNISTLADDRPYLSLDTYEPVLLYRRPNETAYSTIFCWGNNGVEPTVSTSQASACTYLVTDETPPQPPNDCIAIRNLNRDITVICKEGHDGGMPQKFKFSVKALDSEELLLSITSVEPKFIIQETSQENYKFEIVAFNEKGDSKVVEIDKESIVDENTGATVPNTVTNITTLSLALCGVVALVALAACGLVLCTQDRSDTPYRPPYRPDPPLCAYNTEESNCETFHDSDDGSECNIRRTDSFKRAMSRYPSKGFDVRRSSSFHSAKYIDEAEPPTRHHSGCRVHSLQNIRRRDVEVASDQIMHLPDASYNLPQPTTTFYTMPRKGRHKTGKEASDEVSVITQTSDGFSLPPPPDEFGTYRAGTRIKDIPTKTTPTYTTIRKNSSGREPKHQQYSNVLLSPMNTVGLPTISGQSLYSYPVEHHQGTLGATGVLTSFQTHSSPSE